jgi:hypothetical protein
MPRRRNDGELSFAESSGSKRDAGAIEASAAEQLTSGLVIGIDGSHREWSTWKLLLQNGRFRVEGDHLEWKPRWKVDAEQSGC